MSSEELRFAQHLASNDRKTRDKTLVRLRKWIHLRSQKETDEFNKDGMIKLWKGLFYSMWMADKPLIQEELADSISSLIHAFSKPSQIYVFVGCFFKIMGEKHDHIDKFRIDKFLMLTRRFFRESLKYLKNRDWQHKHVQKYLETLRESVLARRHDASQVALGFKLHFFDIFLEEMARIGEGELPRKRAHNFLEPFYEILAYCNSPMVVEGVRDKIFHELIKLSFGARTEGDSEGEDAEGFFDDEPEVDDEALDSDTGEVAGPVSEDEDEDKLAKRRRSDEGFIADEPVAGDADGASEDDGDLEEQLIREREDAAEVILLPIDFDLSAIKESLMEFLKVPSLKGLNKRTLHNIVKKIIDLENGVNPFAAPEEDSGSDLELDENELRLAAKRLKLLEKKYADEAENFLLPDKEEQEEDDVDDFEIDGGEDDLEELEKPIVGKKRKSRK
ncbi:ribosomal RNA processing protein 1 homolog A [Galendromus occidentalis]|uniref:Ribosomal RNA processing protein 1 homolog A n=1 Tax=Galendromus occidentalis TaxID=34638 RepID=A0AAJ6W0F7_9ACAR|nr:ribosomal RNA processing protein 1 homolog A [Galendromus occidentalis]